MAHDIKGLVALHKIARAYGDGLRPDLVAILDQRAPQGAVSLDVPPRSAGPAKHRLTREELAARGVACLTLAGDAARSGEASDG